MLQPYIESALNNQLQKTIIMYMKDHFILYMYICRQEVRKRLDKKVEELLLQK